MMAEGRKATCTCFGRKSEPDHNLKSNLWKGWSGLKHHVLRAVANLPFGVTEEQLREVFQDVGPVKSIRCASTHTSITCRRTPCDQACLQRVYAIM